MTSPSRLAWSAYGILAPLVAHTPDVTTWPGVRHLWFALSVLSAFAVVVGFGFSLVRAWAEDVPLDPWHTARRLIVPVVVSLFALALCHLAIRTVNAALSTLGRGMWEPPPSLASEGIAAVVWWLPWLVTVVLLAVTYLVRLAELAVLTATSGIACAFLATPLEGWSHHWFRLFTAALATQCLQAVILLLARSLAGFLGSSQPMPLLVSIATLWLLWRMPGALFPSLSTATAEALVRTLNNI